MIFHESVFVITGAGSGIGRSLSIGLNQRGAKIALVDLNMEGMKETAQHFQCPKNHFCFFKVDVSSKKEMEELPKKIFNEFGRIDGLINNAGVSLYDKFETSPLSDIEWLININFWGVIYGCKYFLPYLKKNSSSYLVNMSSIFGTVALPHHTAYNASKFAVKGFTESLYQEQKDGPIQVFWVQPGGIKTNIARNTRLNVECLENQDREKFVRFFENRLAITTPDEAANIILQGIIKKKNRILIGSDSKRLDFIQRLFPVKYMNILQSKMKKKQKGNSHKDQLSLNENNS